MALYAATIFVSMAALVRFGTVRYKFNVRKVNVEIFNIFKQHTQAAIR